MKHTREKPAGKIKPIELISNPQRERMIVLLLLAFFCTVEITYAFLSNATWDDDCPTRYYNTLDAFNNPSSFIDIWNRPLFVLVFAVPVHLGVYSIPILMTLIVAASAWALYRYCQINEIRNALIIIPFLLFQAFVFGIARNAETEPLAVALICFGLLAHAKKKYYWFALLGGLLPLARLELTPLLIFWVAILYKEKHWKQIAVMMLPVFTWNLIGFISSGDPIWLWHEAQGDNVNRYGETPFYHYFHRYIHITGPVIFYFFFLGIVHGFTQPRKNTFVLWQFAFGFLVYVVINWKLAMGDAAGFLRNLIPLSPLAALLALNGFNHWSDLFASAKTEKRNRNLTLLASLTLVVVTWLFFSNQLIKHHTLTTDKNYTGLIIIAALSLVPVISATKASILSAPMWRVTSTMMIAGIIAFTLATERWDSNMSMEREVMQEVSDLCLAGAGKERIYANHIWFYWSNQLDKREARYRPINSYEITNAPQSSLVVWDSHYSSSLAGDVTLDAMMNNPNFIELFRIRSADTKFVVIVFRRVANDGSDIMQCYAEALKQFPSMAASIYVNRGAVRQNRLGDIRGGLGDFETAIRNDPNNADAWFNKGATLFMMHNYNGAIEAFDKTIAIRPNYAQAYFNEGVVYANSSRPQEAINCYTAAIKLDDKYVGAYRNRADIYSQTGNFAAAVNDLNIVMGLSPNDANALAQRGIAYYNMKDFVHAKTDLDRAIITQPTLGVAYYYRGMIAMTSNDRSSACADFAASFQLGYTEGKAMWERVCQ